MCSIYPGNFIQRETFYLTLCYEFLSMRGVKFIPLQKRPWSCLGLFLIYFFLGGNLFKIIEK